MYYDIIFFEITCNELYVVSYKVASALRDTKFVDF